MRITIAQLNPTVGDISGNLSMLERTLSAVPPRSSDLVVFPELFLAGYPPRDLLERKWFMGGVRSALDRVLAISKRHPGLGIVLGAPVPTGANIGKGTHNSAILCCDGKILHAQPKSLLPTYDVFDEARYFDPGDAVDTVPFRGETLGLSVCEDAWNDPELFSKRHYSFDPIEVLAGKGVTIIINISASPFHAGKEELRYNLAASHARRLGVPFLLVNQVGGNDELIFDGRSIIVDGKGRPVETLPAFEECVRTVDTDVQGDLASYMPLDRVESVYRALVLGVRDYVRKCGFARVILGLSGGIDSALTCCIACDALGKENVLGVSMPSIYSSRGSVEDSRKLARALGIEFKVISISSIYSSYMGKLKRHFRGRKEDITEENIQARIRGNLLMAYSNKFGFIVLSSGNKSELAVGYCTLYGDMSGGLSVLSDVPKTLVYELSRYVNRSGTVIPVEIMEKAPSAELKPGQTDQDTLPPYEVLDRILYFYLDEGRSIGEITEEGFDRETVRWVIKTVDRNEYKRRQAAPGLKITTKAFGMGRRLPIAARYEN